MRSKKILHVADCEKFIPPYVRFINEHFKDYNHRFLIKSGIANNELEQSDNVRLSGGATFSTLKHYCNLIIEMHSADKIILHSLLDMKLVRILFFTPWLLKKCFWMIWGADLYTYQSGTKNFKWKVKEFFRRPVIRNIGYLVTYLDGDVALARKWYGTKGTYHECLMYTSNLYKEHQLPKNAKATVNIQLGNSADLNNNHIEALEKLLPFKSENICIFVPLSYGDQEYALQVIEQGKKWFGDKFKPLTEFMPFEDYLSFLDSIDIAIFNHRRQQAMGNTITLLGLGKTVYIRSETTQWQLFESQGIKVGDVDNLITLECLNTVENIALTKEYFSVGNYKQQLSKLFEA